MVMVLTFNLCFLMVSYQNLFEMHLYANIFHDDSQNSKKKIALSDHDKVFRLTEEYHTILCFAKLLVSKAIQ